MRPRCKHYIFSTFDFCALEERKKCIFVVIQQHADIICVAKTFLLTQILHFIDCLRLKISALLIENLRLTANYSRAGINKNKYSFTSAQVFWLSSSTALFG